MTDCGDFGLEVGAYHDGELSPSRALQFESHLASGCAACNAELQALRTTSQLLSSGMPMKEMPIDVMGRLHDHVDRAIGSYSDSSLLRLARNLIGLAAAVLIVASAGLWKLQPPHASAPEGWEGTLLSSPQNDSATASTGNSPIDPDLIVADLSRRSTP